MNKYSKIKNMIFNLPDKKKIKLINKRVTLDYLLTEYIFIYKDYEIKDILKEKEGYNKLKI